MKRHSFMLSLSAVFLAGLFFASCSSERNFVVEKRHYTKGYYVHGNGNRNEEKTTALVSTKTTNENSLTPSAPVNPNLIIATNATIENPKPVNSKAESVVKQNQLFSKNPVSGNHHAVSQKNTVEKNATPASHNIFAPKAKKNADGKSGGGDVNGALLVLLCLFIPPLAVFLVDGIGTPFWIDLILCLLFYLPGIIYAFIVCFA
ncbi:MAG TPA: YqaE/Pmp3 family membrane protein [Bacteroidia bacterium]|nr:YqaE/Pmp3 family membrane protein [Bacteroidia bacterium]